ncbi:MAG TPA: discoidin domain-containing protein [Trebonia sp.]|nr:discoidin domain-containing protein [Trebonia sp.]
MSIKGCVLAVLAVLGALLCGFHAPVARAASSPTTPIWSTQLDFDNNGTAWSESFFAGLKSDGLTTAELNMPWGTIEPSAGTFSFSEWDTELANASAVGIQLIPIFWQAGWGGSPASWITDFEEGSGGAQGQAPDWWNPTEQSEYFTYVEDTIQNALAQPGGYGGAILDYGYLDAMWDLGGAGGGYTADDIAEFQGTYLPQAYGTIATFNSDNGTSYSSFSQVPAAAPGQALFGVFQAFRAWSVQQTYGQLTADVRNVTASTPLYYYFGGGFGNATSYANNPDTFFQLAKQYNVTIIDDDASSQGLTLTFGSLARAYGVKVAQEWTAPPDNSQLAAEAVQWISSYAMGLPNGGGEDFFIHDGTEKDTVGFPIYTSWLSNLKSLSGTYPQQPVAVYIDFSAGYGNTSGGSLSNVESQLGNLWLNYQAGFTVVTSQEVNNGAVSLARFKAVLPLNGVDANLTAYKSAGGTVLTEPEQLTQYSTAYAQIDAPAVGVLQAVPAVATNGNSASITLGNITSGTTYNDPIAFSPAGLGLNPGNYYLVNAATGAAVPQAQQSSGLLCATADIGAATLAQWNVVAGTPPAGTASSSCPVTETGATSVTATAGQAANGLQFLGVGQTSSGSDGNLTQIAQGGETAEETWTTSQSGSGDANVYLQLNPMSAVEAAASVTVQVTYWATAGQGFVVQYDTPGNAYQNGPTVSSPGTGTWTTATVQLTGAQFEEAQNGGADLRLNVTNASAPLIVASVTMSVTGNSGPTLTASPTSVSFGNQAVGSASGSQTVTVTNTGTATASLSSISAAAPFSETSSCGSTLAAGASCTASVTFTPTTGGAAAGSLTVASNASNPSLTVALSGTGVTSTTNLALNKPATASSSYQSYAASNATDGNTSTYWESSDGAAYPQTITVNLGSLESIGSVTLDLPPSSSWATRTETLSVLGSTNGSSFASIVASAGYTFNPSTGNTVTISLPSGTSAQYVELSFIANTGWDAAQLSEFEVFPGGGTTPEGPYSGTPAAVPGTVQAANYDTGGQGVAYNVTSVNGTANSYRSDGIDLETCSDTGCGYDLGWTSAGQWFKYTVNVAAAGTYTVSLRVASPSGVSDGLHIANAAGTRLSGNISVPDTGGWQDWGTATATVTLPAGQQTLTVDQDNGGWNFHDMTLATGTGSSPANLALGASVTASSSYQTYVPSNVTDGNTSTYWESTDGAAFPQTITVNLGSAQSIGSITLDLPPSSSWATRTETLSVLGSTNGASFTQIVASAGYTFNPANGNTVTISLPSGTSAQYVQLSFTANTGWSAAQLSEFQVFG